MTNTGHFLLNGSSKIQIFNNTWYLFLSEAVEASLCYFFENWLMKFKCPNLKNRGRYLLYNLNVVFSWLWGLQSLSIWVETPSWNSSCNIWKCTCSIIVMAFDFTKFRKLIVDCTVNFVLHLIDRLSAAIFFTIVLSDEIVPKMQLCVKTVRSVARAVFCRRLLWNLFPWLEMVQRSQLLFSFEFGLN